MTVCLFKSVWNLVLFWAFCLMFFYQSLFDMTNLSNIHPFPILVLTVLAICSLLLTSAKPIIELLNISIESIIYYTYLVQKSVLICISFNLQKFGCFSVMKLAWFSIPVILTVENRDIMVEISCYWPYTKDSYSTSTILDPVLVVSGNGYSNWL